MCIFGVFPFYSMNMKACMGRCKTLLNEYDIPPCAIQSLVLKLVSYFLFLPWTSKVGRRAKGVVRLTEA